MFRCYNMFNNGNEIKTEYVSYFSDILNHDSLFAGDVLYKIFEKLDNKFNHIQIFSDCGSHFRSNNFYRIKGLSKKRNKLISNNFFQNIECYSSLIGYFYQYGIGC